MTAPIKRRPPRSQSSSADMDAIGRRDPALYRVLKSITTSIQSLTAQQKVLNVGSDIPPKGPRAVVASQLGGTIQITISNETSAARVMAYQIWRAAAGTRSSPTTPTYDTASRVAVVQNQGLTNAPSSITTVWIDRDFTIPNLDPANPSRFSYWVSSVDDSFRESIGISASGSPIEVVPNGPGDQVGADPTKASPLNKLQNSAFLCTGTIGNALIESNVAVTNATNLTPITITTSPDHGLATGDKVLIINVDGNLGANGYWIITVTGLATFTLDSSAGTGVFSGAAGSSYVVSKAGESTQPAPVGSQDASNNYGWTPWFNNATAKFTDDGTYFTQEVTLETGQSFAQMISVRKFRPGMHLTFSCYCRIPTQPDNSVLQFIFNDAFGGTRSINISSGVFTSSYSRVSWNFALGTSASPLFAQEQITIQNLNLSGVGQTMFITRPMLVLGDSAPAWTNTTDVDDAPQNQSSGTDLTIQAWARGSTGVYRDASVTYA